MPCRTRALRSTRREAEHLGVRSRARPRELCDEARIAGGRDGGQARSDGAAEAQHRMAARRLRRLRRMSRSVSSGWIGRPLRATPSV